MINEDSEKIVESENGLALVIKLKKIIIMNVFNLYKYFFDRDLN